MSNQDDRKYESLSARFPVSADASVPSNRKPSFWRMLEVLEEVERVGGFSDKVMVQYLRGGLLAEVREAIADAKVGL